MIDPGATLNYVLLPVVEELGLVITDVGVVWSFTGKQRCYQGKRVVYEGGIDFGW